MLSKQIKPLAHPCLFYRQLDDLGFTLTSKHFKFQQECIIIRGEYRTHYTWTWTWTWTWLPLEGFTTMVANEGLEKAEPMNPGPPGPTALHPLRRMRCELYRLTLNVESNVTSGMVLMSKTQSYLTDAMATVPQLASLFDSTIKACVQQVNSAISGSTIVDESVWITCTILDVTLLSAYIQR